MHTTHRHNTLWVPSRVVTPGEFHSEVVAVDPGATFLHLREIDNVVQAIAKMCTH